MEMPPALAAAVALFTQTAVFHQLPTITAWSGPSGSVTVPQVVGLLHRCFIHWVSEWRPADVAAAARHIEASIASTAVERGLSYTSYWMAASLATGALLKVGAVGKPGLEQLFHLADSFIGFTDLHVALGAAVGEEVNVNISLLLSDEAKRCARRRSVHRPALMSMAGNGDNTVAHKTPDATFTAAACSPNAPASPADAELVHMGSAERHWRALLGGIANVVEALRSAGVPAAAVRAVTWATLRYIDGELLNALLLRRDCCSVSAAKALTTGVAALRETASFVGAEWCCSSEDAAVALERSSQAARFLVQGKDDCVRKALKNISILPDLARLCPALTFRQVHRLAEHQHDDWLAGAGGTAGSQNLVLLETLRRLMREHHTTTGARPRGGGGRGGIKSGGGGGVLDHGTGSTRTPPPAAANINNINGAGLPEWVSFGDDGDAPGSTGYSCPSAVNGDEESEEDEEEGLLVDPQASFELFRIQHQLTRRLLTEAAKASIAPPKANSASIPGTAAAAAAAVCTPPGSRSPSGPALPDGSVPQLSPSPASQTETSSTRLPSSVSLLDAIDKECVAAGVPPELANAQAFAFLIEQPS